MQSPNKTIGKIIAKANKPGFLERDPLSLTGVSMTFSLDRTYSPGTEGTPDLFFKSP
jgi:hypothetical protein